MRVRVRGRGGRGGQKGREMWGEGEKVYTNRLCAESVCAGVSDGEKTRGRNPVHIHVFSDFDSQKLQKAAQNINSWEQFEQGHL